MKAAQGKYADAVEAFTRWLEGENGDSCRRGGGGGGPSQAKGLVQLGDAYKGLGQVQYSRAASGVALILLVFAAVLSSWIRSDAGRN